MKRIIKQSFLALGGAKALRCVNKSPRVVFWHGVDEVLDHSVTPEIIELRVFLEQIRYLQKNYEIISIEEFEHRYCGRKFTGKEVVLTFDDGYANNLNVVASVLSERNLPFTVFISTEHIDTGMYYPMSIARIVTKGADLKKIDIPSQNIFITDDNEQLNHLLKTLPINKVRDIIYDLISNIPIEYYKELLDKYSTIRPLTWNEVTELSKVATIGSHCCWHICCHSNQNIKEVEHQIISSRNSIENHLNKPCLYFAYPNGDHTQESDKIVSEYFHLGFSTQGAKRIINEQNAAFIPRICIPGNIDTFKIIIGLNPKI